MQVIRLKFNRQIKEFERLKSNGHDVDQVMYSTEQSTKVLRIRDHQIQKARANRRHLGIWSYCDQISCKKMCVLLIYLYRKVLTNQSICYLDKTKNLNYFIIIEVRQLYWRMERVILQMQNLFMRHIFEL